MHPYYVGIPQLDKVCFPNRISFCLLIMCFLFIFFKLPMELLFFLLIHTYCVSLSHPLSNNDVEKGDYIVNMSKSVQSTFKLLLLCLNGSQSMPQARKQNLKRL